MMKRALIAASLTILAIPAWAQTAPQHKGPRAVDGPALAQAAQQPGADPRLASQTIAALKALLDLREAEMKALAQDAQAKLAERENAWSEYSKPLWAHEAPVAQADAPK